MEIFRSIDEQRAWSLAALKAGKRVGFVPTMGALHAGHLSLITQARAAGAALVVVSIFVNPTQFDNPDDLAAYPRTWDTDVAMLKAAGVDAVFAPTATEMYPDGHATFVEVVGPLTDKLCAIARPGHFRGVATVVVKLLAIVRPDLAIFGQKDLQQVLIVSRLTRDLNLGVDIVVAPTVREPDGLAMSSRNRRLSPESRAKALALPRGLEAARRAYCGGETNALKLCECVYDALLIHSGVSVDYADVIDVQGFVEVDTANDRCVLAVAVFVDDVRLIDHVALTGVAIPASDED